MGSSVLMSTHCCVGSLTTGYRAYAAINAAAAPTAIVANDGARFAGADRGGKLWQPPLVMEPVSPAMLVLGKLCVVHPPRSTPPATRRRWRQSAAVWPPLPRQPSPPRFPQSCEWWPACLRRGHDRRTVLRSSESTGRAVPRRRRRRRRRRPGGGGDGSRAGGGGGLGGGGTGGGLGGGASGAARGKATSGRGDAQDCC